MGFSVSGAAAIIFASMFIAFGVWFTAVDNSFHQINDAQQERGDGVLNLGNTAVELIDVEYVGNDERLEVTVSNNGTKALSLEATDFLVDGEFQADWENDATVDDVGETDLWLPGEVLSITQDRSEQPERVKIVTETGESASAEVVVI